MGSSGQRDSEQEQQQVYSMAAVANTVNIGGFCVTVIEDRPLGIAFQLWPSAHLLADYVAPRAAGKHLLELGAGCGAVGIASAAAGAARVVLTDTRASLQHLQVSHASTSLTRR